VGFVATESQGPRKISPTLLNVRRTSEPTRHRATCTRGGGWVRCSLNRCRVRLDTGDGLAGGRASVVVRFLVTQTVEKTRGRYASERGRGATADRCRKPTAAGCAVLRVAVRCPRGADRARRHACNDAHSGCYDNDVGPDDVTRRPLFRLLASDSAAVHFQDTRSSRPVSLTQSRRIRMFAERDG
jgi:hypothetical protein